MQDTNIPVKQHPVCYICERIITGIPYKNKHGKPYHLKCQEEKVEKGLK
jgi:hypothetical protein